MHRVLEARSECSTHQEIALILAVMLNQSFKTLK